MLRNINRINSIILLVLSVLLFSCSPESAAVSGSGGSAETGNNEPGSTNPGGSTDPDSGDKPGTDENPPSGDDRKDEPDTLSLSLHVVVDGSLGYVPAEGDRGGLAMLYGQDAFVRENGGPGAVPIVYDGSQWKMQDELKFRDTGAAAEFCCWYPMDGEPAEDGYFHIKVQTDQSTDDGFRKSFCLYGKIWVERLSAKTVRVGMSNLASCLTLVLKAGDGWAQEDVCAASVRFCSLVDSAEAKLESGELVLAGDKSEILPLNGGDGTFSAIVLPQTVSGDAVLADITVGGYDYQLKTPVVLEKGKRHSCTMTLERQGGKFGVDVDGWATDDIDYGGDTI